MLSRRAFLLRSAGLAAGAAAGLILPSWVRYAERFIEAEDEPLLEPPQHELTTINAIILPGMDDYRLTIGDPFEEPPAMTWRELYEAYFSDTSDCESYAAFCEEYAGGIQSPDELAPGYFVLESWLGANAAPDTKAFQFLRGMDLGPQLGGGDTVGRIDFVDSPCPGNDARFVSVPDLLSLGLLQKRLNQIDNTVRIKFLGSA